MKILSWLKRLFFKKSKCKDLRSKGILYVKEHFGDRYVDEFLQMYDNLNNGVPIGNLHMTVAFLDMISDVKRWPVEA